MSELLTMVNHLLAAWVSAQTAGGAWKTRDIRVDAQGATIIGELTHGDWRGDLIVRVQIDPAQGIHQTVRFTVEQWPQQMPAVVESLRSVLKTARLTLELDLPAQEKA